MFYLFIFLIGACFGSFAHCISQIFFNNKNINLLKHRSCCYICKKVIYKRDLIPIFSYLYLKGKCRFCGSKIPLELLLIEFLTGSLFLAIFYKFSFTFLSFSLCLFFIILLIQVLIDIRVMMISDFLNVLLMLNAILIVILSRESLQFYFIKSFVCALLIFTISKILSIFIVKKDSLGFGDVKLFFILTGLLLVENIFIFFGLCGVFGVVNCIINKSKKEFPFVPAIFCAFFLAFYFQSFFISLIRCY